MLLNPVTFLLKSHPLDSSLPQTKQICGSGDSFGLTSLHTFFVFGMTVGPVDFLLKAAHGSGRSGFRVLTVTSAAIDIDGTDSLLDSP